MGTTITGTEGADRLYALGADDTLTVWLNGEKLYSDNATKSVDQVRTNLVLKLKPGKNTLLMKICNVDGECGFFFRVGNQDGPPGPWFEDASAKWGLGPDGLASDQKGDTLAVADFNDDGKPDFGFGDATLPSWGSFPVEAVDAAAVHPTNTVLACTWRYHKLMLLPLPPAPSGHCGATGSALTFVCQRPW